MIRPIASLSFTLLPLALLAATAPAPEIEEVAITVLPLPAFDRPAAKTAGKGVAFSMVSTKANQITDETEWFEKNALELERFDPENLPAGIPETFKGLSLNQSLYGSGNTLLLYGKDGSGARYVVGMDSKTGAFRWAFDFVNFLAAPGGSDEFTEQPVTWAVEEDGVLYVSNGHRTYASSSKGKNAYLTAVDVKTGKILWRSQPLVANANTFEVLDKGIVTGYGFTREPDVLYLLNKKTGDVTAREKVKSGPEYILARDGKLYVRCYDTDYVFEVRKK